MSLNAKGKRDLLAYMKLQHSHFRAFKDGFFWGDVAHVFRYVQIEGASSKDRFRVIAGVRPLYEPGSTTGMVWCSRWAGPAPLHRGYWNGSDMHLKQVFDRVFRDEIFPHLDPLCDIQRLEKYQIEHIPLEGGLPQIGVVLTQMVLGKFDLARATWKLVTDRAPPQFVERWLGEPRGQLMLAALSACKNGDISRLRALLQDAERALVTALGIEKYWVAAPFPFENLSAGGLIVHVRPDGDSYRLRTNGG